MKQRGQLLDHSQQSREVGVAKAVADGVLPNVALCAVLLGQNSLVANRQRVKGAPGARLTGGAKKEVVSTDG